MEAIQYAVGKKYKKWATNRDEVQIEYDGASLVFVYGAVAPTQDEQRLLSRGNLMAAFTVLENIPFILVNFEEFGWMDAPFYPNYYPDSYFEGDFAPGTGIAFLILTVDTRNGKLLNIRACGLSNTLSNCLFDECRKLKKLPCQTDAEHKAIIDRIYQEYPSSADMLKTVRPEWVAGIITTP